MAQNVWQQEPHRETPKRNTFDLSFRNNLSMKIGKIYPVMCREVIPGDTFHIKSSFGLSLMPMAFPIQTPLRAHLSFYYVRNRNLWKNWKKFLRNKGQVQPGDFPYIAGSPEHMSEIFKTGGIADYLGCPTTVNQTYSDESLTQEILCPQTTGSVNSNLTHCIQDISTYIFEPSSIVQERKFKVYTYHFKNFANNLLLFSSLKRIEDTDLVCTNSTYVKLGYYGASAPADTRVYYRLCLMRCEDLSNDEEQVLSDSSSYTLLKRNILPHLRVLAVSSDSIQFNYDSTDKVFSSSISIDQVDMIYRNVSAYHSFADVWRENNDGNLVFGLIAARADGVDVKDNDFAQIDSITLFGLGTNVYSSDSSAYTSGQLPISALPFRAYEAIYNALYRNTQNDPFMINGVEEYDKFVTNDDDGADSTDYHIFDAYWEKDCFTQSFQSPQQGNAPLLGLSGTTDAPSSLSPTYLLKYTSEDGSSHNLRVQNDNGSLKFSPLTTLTPDLQGDLDALNSASQFGISINDLRNVNSLQHWLENALMNGYRYRDIIRAHFNIELSLKELEMPEFLGGKSEWININPVTQTSESGNTPQGWQTGQGFLFSEMEHNISKYCDEHGFIIATLTVVPVPVYQQLLPKFFTKFGVLDYFSPEFAHIGLQPMKYKEICPLETLNAGDNIEDVFAYQRPWYDYLSAFDEAHGQFRDTLSGFLMTRIFEGKPVLGADFLKIDNKTTDNVFVVTAGEDDKIFGQVCFDVKAERPIPLFHTPKLE